MIFFMKHNHLKCIVSLNKYKEEIHIKVMHLDANQNDIFF